MEAWEFPPWTHDEDQKIVAVLERGNKQGDWIALAKELGRTHGALRMRACKLRARMLAAAGAIVDTPPEPCDWPASGCGPHIEAVDVDE